jgi:hypothetical protein
MTYDEYPAFDSTYYRRFNPVYNTAWVDVHPDDWNNDAVIVGQRNTGGNFYIWRDGVFFDMNTAPIPSYHNVDRAEIALLLTQDLSTPDFDIVVQSGSPVYPHVVADPDDYDKANYAGNYGSINTADLLAVGNWNYIPLNAAGLALINKTGTTKFMLRSSRDIAGTAPGVGGAEVASFNVLAKLRVWHSTGPSSLEIPSSTDDSAVSNGDNNYNTCRTAVNGTPDIGSSSIGVGQIRNLFPPPTYSIMRPVFYFDTRSVPRPSAIVSGYLVLYGDGDFTTGGDFDIVLQKGNGVAPHKPVIAGDYDMTQYSGNGGSLNTLGFLCTALPNILNLNGTGMSWINYGGFTSFMLRSGNDINGIAPGSDEFVSIFTANAVDPTKVPLLVLVYKSGRELIAPPSFSLTWEAGSFGR